MAKPYTIICKDTDPQWLDERHNYVTASQVANLFNEHKWGPDFDELVAEKSGPVPPPLDDSVNMWHGREDEANNMRKFAKAMGFKYKQAHTFLASTEVPGLAATLDGICINHVPQLIPHISKDFETWGPKLKDTVSLVGGTGLLEMKQTEAWWKKDWGVGTSDEAIPRYYWWQVQAQLLVTGMPWGIIACQIGAAMFRAYFVEPDKSAHNHIKERVELFWKLVKGKA